MQKVANVCDTTMPKKGKGNPHTPIHWLSNKIAQLRSECHKAKRLSQGPTGKPTFPELNETSKLATLDVKNAFNSARWKNICLALDRLGIPTYLKMIKSYLENRQIGRAHV